MTEKHSIVEPWVRSATLGREEFVDYPARSSTRAWYGVVPDHYAGHWHGDVEIIMMLQGRCRVTVGEQVFHLKEGEVLFIPAGQTHSITMPKDSARYLFQFQLDPVIGIHDFSHLRRMLITPLYLHAEWPLTQQVRTLLTTVAQEEAHRDSLSDLSIYACLLKVYAMLGRAWDSGELADVSVPNKAANQMAIDQALNIITRHYMEPLDLDTVARSVNFSRYHFSRLFRRYTGQNFSDYLRHKRVSIAAQLLVYSDLPVAQVATRSGFASISTFTRCFREQLGMCPTAYRQMSREGMPLNEQTKGGSTHDT